MPDIQPRCLYGRLQPGDRVRMTGDRYALSGSRARGAVATVVRSAEETGEGFPLLDNGFYAYETINGISMDYGVVKIS